MIRESRRSLHSLLPEYQNGITSDDYEVIALDNGSSLPLDGKWVESLSPNFRYKYFDTESVSPCVGINYAVSLAKAENILIIIDGARILTPGMLNYSLLVADLFPRYFAYSIAMHIGNESQNISMLKGYNQDREDELLKTINWHKNGYSLFSISCLAGSSKGGFLKQPAESNCFAMTKSDFLSIGGYEERFQAPGGGTANLEFFNRVNTHEDIQPVMLLGEATFHQFHGGVTTNVPPKEHPREKNQKEFREIKNKPYELFKRPPIFFGHWPEECTGFLSLNI